MSGGLVVGLGNPGRQYEMTRHNMGFMFVDAVTRQLGATTASGDKFRCELWKASLGGDTWLFAKPQTFMNLSGESVQPLAAWHRIPPDRIFVVHDELDLAPGRMKFKLGGGNAGHNGLKSITQRLGTPDFYRLRLGIGRSPHASEEVVNWVLGRLTTEESTLFDAMLPDARKVLDFFIAGDVTAATRHANGFKLPQPAKPAGE